MDQAMAQQIETRPVRLQGRLVAWLRKPLGHKLRSTRVKAIRALHWVADASFDRRHRIDCGGFIRSQDLQSDCAATLPHARAYEAITCAVMGQVLAEAKKTGIVFDRFIDIGSGKGKACFYAAAKGGFRNIIGIEFSAPLVEVADANKKKFGAHDISFLTMDATAFSLPSGDNLVLLFNPFGEVVLQRFLENNLERFRSSRTVIAYANDQHRLCLAKLGFVTLFRNQDAQLSLYQYL